MQRKIDICNRGHIKLDGECFIHFEHWFIAFKDYSAIIMGLCIDEHLSLKLLIEDGAYDDPEM